MSVVQLERLGNLVFWRVAIKPGRPVAMGVIGRASDGERAAFVGLPGNPVAVFVTFVCVVKPLLRRLSAPSRINVAAAGACGFAYKKKKIAASTCVSSLKRAGMGEIEAIEHRRIARNLDVADGNRWLDVFRDVTTVEPGAVPVFFLTRR